MLPDVIELVGRERDQVKRTVRVFDDTCKIQELGRRVTDSHVVHKDLKLRVRGRGVRTT